MECNRTFITIKQGSDLLVACARGPGPGRFISSGHRIGSKNPYLCPASFFVGRGKWHAFFAPGTPSALSKSTEISLTKSVLISAAYGIRTKSAKSRGLEKGGRRERIFGLRRGARSAELCARRPVFIGIFPPSTRQRIFGAVRLAERVGFEFTIRPHPRRPSSYSSRRPSLSSAAYSIVVGPRSVLQYSSASMMVSTRSVTAGSAGSGEWQVRVVSK